MKKFVVVLLAVTMLMTTFGLAASKGGVMPCLASCFMGPRVGLEMNEGSKIRQIEWIGLVGSFVFAPIRLITLIDPTQGKTMNAVRAEENLGGQPVMAIAPKEKGGCVPFLASCCFGSRVGLEMNNGRKVRNMELYTLIPIVGIVPTVIILHEAYSGKTMSGIAASERLDR